MERILKILVLLMFTCQCFAFSQVRTTPGNIADYERTYGTLGTYGNPPRLENGRVDTHRLLSELKDIHANTYHWLIWGHPYDWDDLKEFLPMARKAKLKVWVTIVPPTESKPIYPKTSDPFCLDYERWASELATLSLSEKNLVVWSIDDFVHNLKFFTPEYTKKMLDIARAINPKLAFIPCCYYKQTTDSVIANYVPLLDGILYPYRAESKGKNLQDATQVENEITRLRKMIGNPDFPIILDIYASAHTTLGATTPQYVKEVLTTGMKCADGVLIFCHQDPVKSPAKYKIIKEGFRKKHQMFRKN